MHRHLFYLLLLAVLPQLCWATAQHPPALLPQLDTLSCDSATGFTQRLDCATSTRLFRATYVAVPLIGAGQIIKQQDKHFRQLRNDYLPAFTHHLDDYLQYAPAAALLSMKLGGLESRSDWGRMLTAHAFSVAITASAINSLKYTTRITRPDGSTQNSFPSGHTATAFMTATMFNREYGTRYPWLGFTAYAAASTTGLMRMANNRHWLSDVLTGAGIGILSTEIGYWLSDLIFGRKGVREAAPIMPRSHHPSFLALYIGVNAPLERYSPEHETSFQTAPGATAGVEGAYFFHPHFGIGGRFTASNIRVLAEGKTEDLAAADQLTFAAGGYLCTPISQRWGFGSKLIAGVAHYPYIKLGSFEHRPHVGFCIGTGASFTYQQTTHFGMRFFVDYDLHPRLTDSHSHLNSWITTGASAVFLF